MLFISLIFLFLSSLQLCYAPTTAYPPICDEYYGNPDPSHCDAILNGVNGPNGINDRQGIYSIDFLPHAFTVKGAQRQAESDEQWANRVELPRLWSKRIASLLYSPK